MRMDQESLWKKSRNGTYEIEKEIKQQGYFDVLHLKNSHLTRRNHFELKTNDIPDWFIKTLSE